MVTTALQSCCDVILSMSHVSCFLISGNFLDCTSPEIHSCLFQGWGLTVTLGVPEEKPEVRAHYGLFLTGRTLKGTLFGGWKPKSDLPSLVDMYTKKVCGELLVNLLDQTYVFWAFIFSSLTSSCCRCYLQRRPFYHRVVEALDVGVNIPVKNVVLYFHS